MLLSLFFALHLEASLPKKCIITEIRMYQDLVDDNIRNWEKGGGDCSDGGFFYLVGMRNGLDIALEIVERDKKLHPD